MTLRADMHLAELNIGRLIAPTDDPRVADFMANLDRINGHLRANGASNRAFGWDHLRDADLWRANLCAAE